METKVSVTFHLFENTFYIDQKVRVGVGGLTLMLIASGSQSPTLCKSQLFQVYKGNGLLCKVNETKVSNNYLIT